MKKMNSVFIQHLNFWINFHFQNLGTFYKCWQYWWCWSVAAGGVDGGWRVGTVTLNRRSYTHANIKSLLNTLKIKRKRKMPPWHCLIACLMFLFITFLSFIEIQNNNNEFWSTRLKLIPDRSGINFNLRLALLTSR